MRDYEKTGKDCKSLPLWGRWLSGSEVRRGKASPTASGPPFPKGKASGRATSILSIKPPLKMQKQEAHHARFSGFDVLPAC